MWFSRGGTIVVIDDKHSQFRLFRWLLPGCQNISHCQQQQSYSGLTFSWTIISYSTYLWELILFTFCLFIQTTDVDWTEAVIPFAIIVFLVFIFDFYIESFCLAKLESTRTGKVGSIASFLSAVILSFLWDQPWAWSMHEWHRGKPSEPHLVSAGTLFAAFFFVLGEWFDANISSLPSAGKWKVEGMTRLSQSKWVLTIKVLFLL